MMHHGMLDTMTYIYNNNKNWCQYTKCVWRKIQHFTPSNLVEHWWIHYNYITIIPKVGNTIYYVYSKQYTQEI